MDTIRYYLNNDKYMGWEKYNFKNKYLTIKSWLLSGHYVIIKNCRIDTNNINILNKLI